MSNNLGSDFVIPSWHDKVTFSERKNLSSWSSFLCRSYQNSLLFEQIPKLTPFICSRARTRSISLAFTGWMKSRDISINESSVTELGSCGNLRLNSRQYCRSKLFQSSGGSAFSLSKSFHRSFPTFLTAS